MIRKAYKSGWNRLHGAPNEVTTQDVIQAIHQTKEFSIFKPM